MGAMTSSKLCASWNLSLLICTMGMSKSIISIPILQMRKQRLDQSLLAAELMGQGHSTVAWLLPVQMRCESSLQTLLSVSRVVATNSTPREAGASMGAALRASQKIVLCSYLEIQSLKDLRENFIRALGRMHATCRCRN